MNYAIAFILFILIYVLLKFGLEKVPSLAPLAEVLGVVGGALGALLYLGALGR